MVEFFVVDVGFGEVSNDYIFGVVVFDVLRILGEFFEFEVIL